MHRLTGRTAIVTGGAGGIGFATARRLTSEGGQVVVADINLEGAEAVAREIRDNGGDAIALHVDLGDPNSIKKLIDDTLTHYGKLEVVFNNGARSEEHTSELQSLMRNSYAVFCLKKKTKYNIITVEHY